MRRLPFGKRAIDAPTLATSRAPEAIRRKRFTAYKEQANGQRPLSRGGHALRDIKTLPLANQMLNEAYEKST